MARYKTSLAGLKRRNRLRFLSSSHGYDFSSNDFLALSSDSRLKQSIQDALSDGVPVGAGGSRLLRGNDAQHELLEREAAVFFSTERALFFSTGYLANYSVLSTLPQRGDLIVYDELIHASMHEGMKAGKAEFRAAQHSDIDSFSEIINSWRNAGGRGGVWIVIESIYSMDGDCAPLNHFVELAGRYCAFLVIDEAHATGVFGDCGRGLAANHEGAENIIVIHTCGKALGAAGALVCLKGILADYLINRARAFIYSTAPSPLIAAAVRCSLRILQDEPQRQLQLNALVEYMGKKAAALSNIALSGTHIQPVLIGDAKKTMSLAKAMQADGFDIRGIRSPTVAENTSRLRIAITLNVSESVIADMVDCLVENMGKFGL